MPFGDVISGKMRQSFRTADAGQEKTANSQKAIYEEATKTSCCEPEKKKEKYCPLYGQHEKDIFCDDECKWYDKEQDDCGLLVALNRITNRLDELCHLQ